jgi:hypothetical protein
MVSRVTGGASDGNNEAGDGAAEAVSVLAAYAIFERMLNKVSNNSRRK